MRLASNVDRGEITRCLSLPVEQIGQIADWLRLKAFESILSASSGHLGAAGSSAELFACLYFGGIANLSLPSERCAARDRVLVRGHLGPIRYPLFSLLGHVGHDELKSYRQLGSRLQGHEDHLLLDAVDISPSGSLGMLLSNAVGCLVTPRAKTLGFRAFVFLGDGEEQEGVVSEAARYAAHLKLGRLIAILDKNGKQLSCATEQTCSSDLVKTWEGYGWRVLEIRDGHDVTEIIKVLRDACLPETRPCLIVANTIKGNGLLGANDHISGYHTLGVTPREIAETAVDRLSHSLGAGFDPYTLVEEAPRVTQRFEVPTGDAPVAHETIVQPTAASSADPTEAQTEYFLKLGSALVQQHPSRAAFFLTSDVTYYSTIKDARIDENMSFYNVGLREQHMIAMAHGISLTEPNAVVIVNTSDAFTYRGIDQLNAAAQGSSKLIVVGDVAGLTEGRNGRSHQTSGQPGALVSMPGLVFWEPADTIDLFSCLNEAVNFARGPVFIRVSRGKVEPFSRQKREHGLGHYRAWWPTNEPDLVIVASGLPVGRAVAAAKQLELRGTAVGVISVVEQNTLGEQFAQELVHARPVLTVYNGHPEILQRSVASATYRLPNTPKPSIIRSLGFESGTSASPEELIKLFGLDIEGIVLAAQNLINDLGANLDAV